jgi:hypothetical protein
MHVIFVEPAFPGYQRHFVRALHQVGAQVTGVGERPWEHMDGELQGWLSAYERVASVTDETALTAAVRQIQGRSWVDRLEATIEAHVLPVARVREACTIPGTTVATAFYCRDKPEMKRLLRDLDIPCAQSDAAASALEVRELVRRFGYPVILKPRDAAGAAGTWKVDSDAALEQAMGECGVIDGASIAVEEFIEGHEGFYDTLTINGEVEHEFISHYYPNVLEAMRTRWISPQIVATNRLDAPGYGEVRELGRRVIEAMDIGTSATHMEWFFGPPGLKFSEIGCRPPGVAHWDVYNDANDFDLYREWATAIVHGHGERRPSRQYSAGIIALRPDRDVHISAYEGTEAVWSRYGGNITRDYFPPPGTPTQPVEAGYMANAWMRLRHPDYDRLREILNDIGSTIRVRAQ